MLYQANIKYSIFLKGTFQEEIYIRIGYNLEEYKSNIDVPTFWTLTQNLLNY